MDPRLEDINNLLIQYSLGDFSQSIHPSDKGDDIDAFINNINMLGEQLKTAVISREQFNNITHSVSDMLHILGNKGGIRSSNKAPFVTPYVSMEIRDDILYVTYLEGVDIKLDIAKELVKQRLEYTNGFSYPALVTGEGFKQIDKEAREYLSKEGCEGISAGALLVYSVYTKLFGDFFLRVHPSRMPSKLFTNKQEALKWLESFKAPYKRN
jgi:hypothetical protein